MPRQHLQRTEGGQLRPQRSTRKKCALPGQRRHAPRNLSLRGALHAYAEHAELGGRWIRLPPHVCPAGTLCSIQDGHAVSTRTYTAHIHLFVLGSYIGCCCRTGRRPDTSRVWTIGPYFRDTTGANWVTLPQFFKQHGYVTAGAGKLFHHGGPSGYLENRSTTPPTVIRDGDDYPHSVSALPKDASQLRSHAACRACSGRCRTHRIATLARLTGSTRHRVGCPSITLPGGGATGGECLGRPAQPTNTLC
jgi:hypothetical protein